MEVVPTTATLRTVTGETAPLQGSKTVQLTIGTFRTPHPMWVAKIADECIIGMDFLQSHGCLVNPKEGILQIGDEEIPLHTSQVPEPGCYRCCAGSSISLPPKSENLVPGREWKFYGRWAVLQPEKTMFSQAGVIVGKTLVDLQGEQLPVRVLNLSNEPVQIKKGTLLATCEPVLSVLRANHEENLAQANVSKLGPLPTHVKELFERAAVELLPCQKDALYALLHDYADIFSQGPQDLGQTNLAKHRVDTGDATPLRQAPRRLPLLKREEAQKAIQDMHQQGLIEPSTSPWCSPIVLVKKKDGGLRFCVDYRRLNAVTRKDSYPLPRIDDTLEALSGMQLFSTLDLRSGYWQVPMEDAAKEKTAFSAGRGLWQFRVMPFGLCNAPATFERLMEHVLSGLPLSVALVYIDDVLVPGRTFADHLSNLHTVFQRIRSANLKLAPHKCMLLQQKVGYLGHVISGEGISTDPRKIEAINTWPSPESVSQLRSFLGLCSYYRRFIPFFADIARPLHKMLEAGQPFNWTQEAESVFQKLKRMLVEAPILGYPVADAPFILDTDASNNAIGAVLSQFHEGQERVIAYYSRTLTSPEKQYCVTRKELLAVVQAVKHFHSYLYGRHFTVRTDHAALKWLFNFKNPEGQVARWIQRLQEYDYEIQHRQGLKHNNADALSRRPCLAQYCKHCDRLESREAARTPDKTNAASLEKETIVASVRLAGTLDVESYNDLRKAQEQDGDLKPILMWREKSDTRPNWEAVAPHSPTTKLYWAQWRSLHLREGVLHRLWETPAGDNVVWQLLLPRSMWKEVFLQLHATPTSGHLGVKIKDPRSDTTTVLLAPLPKGCKILV